MSWRFDGTVTTPSTSTAFPVATTEALAAIASQMLLSSRGGATSSLDATSGAANVFCLPQIEALAQTLNASSLLPTLALANSLASHATANLTLSPLLAQNFAFATTPAGQPQPHQHQQQQLPPQQSIQSQSPSQPTTTRQLDLSQLLADQPHTSHDETFFAPPTSYRRLSAPEASIFVAETNFANERRRYSDFSVEALLRQPNHRLQLADARKANSRKQRTIYGLKQTEVLEEAFHSQRYLVGAERETLAARLGLSEAQVRVWFQNRRSKQRKLSRRAETNFDPSTQ